MDVKLTKVAVSLNTSRCHCGQFKISIRKAETVHDDRDLNLLHVDAIAGLHEELCFDIYFRWVVYCELIFHSTWMR